MLFLPGTKVSDSIKVLLEREDLAQAIPERVHLALEAAKGDYDNKVGHIRDVLSVLPDIGFKSDKLVEKVFTIMIDHAKGDPALTREILMGTVPAFPAMQRETNVKSGVEMLRLVLDEAKKDTDLLKDVGKELVEALPAMVSFGFSHYHDWMRSIWGQTELHTRFEPKKERQSELIGALITNILKKVPELPNYANHVFRELIYWSEDSKDVRPQIAETIFDMLPTYQDDVGYSQGLLLNAMHAGYQNEEITARFIEKALEIFPQMPKGAPRSIPSFTKDIMAATTVSDEDKMRIFKAAVATLPEVAEHWPQYSSEIVIGLYHPHRKNKELMGIMRDTALKIAPIMDKADGNIVAGHMEMIADMSGIPKGVPILTKEFARTEEAPTSGKATWFIACPDEEMPRVAIHCFVLPKGEYRAPDSVPPVHFSGTITELKAMVKKTFPGFDRADRKHYDSVIDHAMIFGKAAKAGLTPEATAAAIEEHDGSIYNVLPEIKYIP